MVVRMQSGYETRYILFQKSVTDQILLNTLSLYTALKSCKKSCSIFLMSQIPIQNL